MYSFLQWMGCVFNEKLHWGVGLAIPSHNSLHSNQKKQHNAFVQP